MNKAARVIEISAYTRLIHQQWSVYLFQTPSKLNEMVGTNFIPIHDLLPFENGTNHFSAGGFTSHLSGKNLKGSGYMSGLRSR